MQWTPGRTTHPRRAQRHRGTHTHTTPQHHHATHARAYAHTRAHTHTHTHTHTRAPSLSSIPWLVVALLPSMRPRRATAATWDSMTFLNTILYCVPRVATGPPAAQGPQSMRTPTPTAKGALRGTHEKTICGGRGGGGGGGAPPPPPPGGWGGGGGTKITPQLRLPRVGGHRARHLDSVLGSQERGGELGPDGGQRGIHALVRGEVGHRVVAGLQRAFSRHLAFPTIHGLARHLHQHRASLRPEGKRNRGLVRSNAVEVGGDPIDRPI